MTRILPASGADLAHFSSRRDRDWYRRASSEALTQPAEGRQQGNRRMGDRRGDSRRAGGRRADDHRVRQTAQTWLSADFTAHLIGQAEGQSSVQPRAAANAYAQAGSTDRKRKGDVI